MPREVVDGEELFLVEGTLSEVQHAATTLNLLEQIERRVKAKGLATGAAAALGGMHGMLANSAMVALYDGEDMYCFAGLLGNQVICGTFESGDAFKDGDRVKAVVSRRGDVLYAHAVMREDDKMLFMPLTTIAGKNAHFRYCMRSAWRACVFGWLAFGALNFFTSGPWEMYIVLLGAMPALMFPFELWTYRSTRDLGYRASAIFRVFGFPRPDDLDLTDAVHVYMPGDAHGARHAFNYERALALHAKRFS